MDALGGRRTPVHQDQAGLAGEGRELQLVAALLVAGGRGRGRHRPGELVADAGAMGAAGVVAEATRLAHRHRIPLSEEEPPSRLDVLTAREREVLGVLVTGATNRVIGEQLFRGPEAGQRPRDEPAREAGCANRGEAAALARELAPADSGPQSPARATTAPSGSARPCPRPIDPRLSATKSTSSERRFSLHSLAPMPGTWPLWMTKYSNLSPPAVRESATDPLSSATLNSNAVTSPTLKTARMAGTTTPLATSHRSIMLTTLGPSAHLGSRLARSSAWSRGTRRKAVPRTTCLRAGTSSTTLHFPGKVDRRAHSTGLCPIEIGLDLMVRLHARRHTEASRVGLE